eukprot:TRINITY_DN9258_c0_g3_i8.p3 TRINITY_DN9258_c0_g3~~TRINITY_DN9258_c0_g3_i8.p3  ORF type:complete len:197 (+),score=31.46 TRINITY_DN9258_c0_g3_i8:1717-2307(+)
MRLKIITREWEREKTNILTLYSIQATSKYVHLCRCIRKITDKARDGVIRSYYSAAKTRYIAALAKWASSNKLEFSSARSNTLSRLGTSKIKPEVFARSKFSPDSKADTRVKSKFQANKNNPQRLESTKSPRLLFRSVSEIIASKKNTPRNFKPSAKDTVNTPPVKRSEASKKPEFVFCPVRKVLHELILNAAKHAY